MAGRLTKWGGGFSALALIFLMLGCGGGSGTTTQLRVLAASPDETTNVQALVDGAALGSSLAYEANTGYQSVTSGSRQFAVEAVGTTTNLLPNDATLTLGSNTETTVIMAGFSSSLQGLVLTDDNTEPATNTANLRVVNAAPSLGAVDVYVVPQGTSLSSVAPTFGNLGFAQASLYTNVNIASSANYEIYFTQVGVPTFVYLDSGPITFGSGQNRTIVGLNNTSGGSYTYVMLKDLN
ncbi:MAG: DUF4397 domain-containing protein [Terriglobales bacterium]